MGWNKCNKFLLKKNKGQGVLTPAQNKQLQFKRTLFCNKKKLYSLEGYDSNKLALLCTFCIFFHVV